MPVPVESREGDWKRTTGGPMSRVKVELPVAAAVAVVALAGAWMSWWWSFPPKSPDEAVEVDKLSAEHARATGLPDPPPGAYIVLLPDALRAIDRPVFVPASRAHLEADSPMVLVRGKSEERAYSLRLLNQHEIVNDLLDGEPVAVTW